MWKILQPAKYDIQINVMYVKTLMCLVNIMLRLVLKLILAFNSALSLVAKASWSDCRLLKTTFICFLLDLSVFKDLLIMIAVYK